MERDETYGPSRRALATFKNGKAWDLMMQVKQRPHYDPIHRPDGIIDLSGAQNGLMKDWMEQYTAEYASDLHIADRGFPSARHLSKLIICWQCSRTIRYGAHHSSLMPWLASSTGSLLQPAAPS